MISKFIWCQLMKKSEAERQFGHVNENHLNVIDTSKWGCVPSMS